MQFTALALHPRLKADSKKIMTGLSAQMEKKDEKFCWTWAKFLCDKEAGTNIARISPRPSTCLL